MPLLSLLFTLLVLFSLITLSVSQSADSTETHVTDEDHDIAQPTRTPGTPGMGTPRDRTPRPLTTPARSRIPLRPRPGRLIRPRDRPGMIRDPDFTRPGMFRDPDFFSRRPWMSGRMIRLSMLERRAILDMFRDLLRLRLRSMLTWPSTRWEQKMLRLMVLRDMMMMMDVQAEDAAEISDMVERHEAAGDFDDLYEPETQDDTYTAVESDTEDIETDEVEPETQVADHDVEHPSLVEAEFEISAPYGYGGYGGYGGFGGYGGYGGYGGKKTPYKKIPYKKKPFPPKKKGGFGGGFI